MSLKLSFLFLFFYNIESNFSGVTINSKNEISFVNLNLDGNTYCDLVQELYLETEWYFSKLTHIDNDGEKIIQKIVNNLLKLFYDRTRGKIRRTTRTYENLATSTLEVIEKSFGILNPLLQSDWNEIFVIFLAQVSKRLDKNGSVCLRPSQSAMVLYGFLQSSLVSLTDKNKFMLLYLNNLKENYNFDVDLENAVFDLYSKENPYYKFKEKFEIERSREIQSMDSQIYSSINGFWEENVLSQTLENFILQKIDNYNIGIQQTYDYMNTIQSNYFQKMVFVITNKNSSLYLNMQNNKMIFAQENSPLYSEWTLGNLKLNQPVIENQNQNSNWFENIFDYILLENYYSKHSEEKRGFDQLEIINKEKSRIDINLINELEVNSNQLYKLSEADIELLKSKKQDLINFQQQYPQFLKMTLKQFFNEQIKERKQFLKIIYDISQEKYIFLMFLNQYGDYFMTFFSEEQNKNLIKKFITKYIRETVSQQIKAFINSSQNDDNTQKKEILLEILKNNFKSFNKEEKIDYLNYFLVYNYQVFNPSLSLDFIINLIKATKEEENIDQTIEQFIEVYSLITEIDNQNFDQLYSLKDDKINIKQKLKSKLNKSINVIGYVSYLLIQRKLSKILLAYDVVAEIISIDEYIDQIKQTETYQSFVKEVKLYKDKIQGNLIKEEFLKQLEELEDLNLFKTKELKYLTNDDLNLKKNMLKINEESFQSYEGKVMWMNLKPALKNFKIEKLI